METKVHILIHQGWHKKICGAQLFVATDFQYIFTEDILLLSIFTLNSKRLPIHNAFANYLEWLKCD